MRDRSKRPSDFITRYAPRRVKFPGVVSEEKTKEFMDEYYEAYPKIKEAHRRLKCQKAKSQ